MRKQISQIYISYILIRKEIIEFNYCSYSRKPKKNKVININKGEMNE